MNDLILKEIIFVEENADLLRNNHDPVMFEIVGHQSKYCILMMFNPFCVHITINDDNNMVLSFDNRKYVVNYGWRYRKMTRKEKILFKSFIDKIYERSKKQHDSWY